MTKKRARQVQQKESPKPVHVEQEPAWVTDMHEHYRECGYYRTEDLERVLGDPRDSVAIQGDELVLTNFATRK